MTSSHLAQKKIIRQHFRALRKAMSQAEQIEAANSLVEQFSALTKQKQPQNIAVFLANDGELNPQQVIEYCWKHGINTYLPVVDVNNPGHLLFCQYTANTPLAANQYGILEPVPDPSIIINHWSLDWVLMPLVAFTEQGQRLGMGGGFYDRTFSSLTSDKTISTRLIGLAHECQCAQSLPVDSWDINMHAIMTPSRYIPL